MEGILISVLVVGFFIVAPAVLGRAFARTDRNVLIAMGVLFFFVFGGLGAVVFAISALYFRRTLPAAVVAEVPWATR